MRIETRRSDGYERVRAWDPEEQAERYCYIHRLAAVAWGILDGLDDPRHVHHVEAVPWYNSESNLEAVEPDYHALLTMEQTERRGSV